MCGSSVSTPSAITFMPSLCAIMMMASDSAMLPEPGSSLRVKDWSIFR